MWFVDSRSEREKKMKRERERKREKRIREKHQTEKGFFVSPPSGSPLRHLQAFHRPAPKTHSGGAALRYRLRYLRLPRQLRRRRRWT